MSTETVPFIDTHQHLWDLTKFQLPWLKDVPALNRSYLLADYLAESKGCNVGKTIYMEVDVQESQQLEEARALLKMADDPQTPIEGVIASGRPESEDFPKYLDQIAGHKKLKGIRRVLHVVPDETSQSPLFAENVRRLKQYGLTYDICVAARQMPLAIELTRKCPEASLVLDHCGVPDVKGRALDPWRGHIQQIASFPNVVCKVSGVIAYADPTRPFADQLRPFVEHVLECFGWDRVVWGSDWPVCKLTASYRQWVDAALEITKNARPADRAKLFSKNAERVYRV